MTDQEREFHEISMGLAILLDGKSKRLALTAALSVAATTAHMIGMPKLEAQRMFVEMYDRRVAEQGSPGAEEPTPGPSPANG